MLQHQVVFIKLLRCHIYPWPIQLAHDPDMILSSFEMLCFLSFLSFVVMVHRGPLRVK